MSKSKAAKALARFMSLHPHNIAQKTEVMLEHFHTFTRHKIAGRAKAMVVTGSRLHAVRYKLEFDRQIKEKGYTEIKTLVAFSGTVEDPDVKGVSYTEPDMNRQSNGRPIKEKELAGEIWWRRVPIASSSREIPNRLRSAASAHHVRGQTA